MKTFNNRILIVPNQENIKSRNSLATSTNESMMLEYNYCLQDAAETSRLYPGTIKLPHRSDIKRLTPGDLVKLVFVNENLSEGGCAGERMWVRITSVRNAEFLGLLDNEPSHIKTIKIYDTVSFKNENIIQIYK